jgi:threonine dehydratase
LALEWILRYVHDVVTVTDAEAFQAMREILLATHNLAEGAGALAWAAIKKYRQTLPGTRIGCVLSGGNASLALLADAIKN